MCSFCNQRHITGQSSQPSADDVEKAVMTAVNSKHYDAKYGQIAFFGGSFTAIDMKYMISLLSAAKKCIDKGYAKSIRVSTRPDAISQDILDVLKEYGVESIELGAQSMSDDVLKMNERGHTALQVAEASKLIKANGFELGLQMMTGLLGDDFDKSVYTAEKFIELKPDTVRIYPTVVLNNTRLCELYKIGEYAPQTVEEAAELGAKLLLMFKNNNINVIRFGLHSIDESQFVAGAWHPSLAEIAYSKIYLSNATKLLSNEPSGNYIIYVGKSYVSQMSGNRKSNLEKLKKMGYNCRIKTNDLLEKYDVNIKREELT